MRRHAPLALAVMAVCTAIPTSLAQTASLHLTLTAADSSSPREMILPRDKTAVIDLPAEAADVVVSNPEIVDAVVRNANRVYLIGKKIGQSNAFFFDRQGRPIGHLDIRVEPDAQTLNTMIAKIVPAARVRAEALSGSLILTGTVPSAADADRVLQLAKQLLAGAQGQGAAAATQAVGSYSGNIVNSIVVEGEEQVLIKVRVIELSRNIVKQLGINVDLENIINRVVSEDTFVNLATANGFSIAGQLLGGLTASGGLVDNTVQPNSLSFPGSIAGSVPPETAGVGGFEFDPADTIINNPDGTTTLIPRTTFGPGSSVTNQRIGATVRAFERAGLARTLAEPNLTAISGESAKFLAGGEFPVPVAADNGQIAIAFREFGIGLAVTPLVLSGGRISLKIATEVSDLSQSGAITLQGISIPALSVRRAETTVEMPSGSAMVIAGLIQESTRQAIEGVPGAKDLPVLGAAFRSRDFVNNDTEIVIIVTPYLVKPTDPKNLKTPLDGYRNASDAGGFFRQRLNAVYKAPSGDAGGKALEGPQGHVIP
jgi:pilus assembly protein CpaC